MTIMTAIAPVGRQYTTLPPISLSLVEGPEVKEEVRPPIIDYKQRVEPDNSSVRGYSFEWGEPRSNSYSSRQTTLLWAQEVMEREECEWSDFVLIHGRNKSYLNLKLGVGVCPMPTQVEELIVCIGKENFRYRSGCIIDIERRPCTSKASKVATLCKEGTGETYRIEFLGSIQNLIFNYRHEVEGFFNR